MATLATIRSEIRGVLLPSAASSSASIPDSRINAAINEAIADLSRKDVKPWFQTGTQAYSTVGSQASLGALPSDFGSVRSLSIVDADFQYILQQIDIAGYLEKELFIETRPEIYTFIDGLIKLLPIPDKAYSATLYYYKKYADLVNDGDTNDWTNEAPSLVKYYALSNLYRDELKDFEFADRYATKALEIYNDMAAQSARLASTGFVRDEGFYTSNLFNN